MYKTYVVWPMPLTQTQQDTKAERDAKSAAMAAQGKTDNIPVVTGGTYPDPLTVTRTWTTQADAEEWTNFLEAYGPTSIVITPV